MFTGGQPRGIEIKKDKRGKFEIRVSKVFEKKDKRGKGRDQNSCQKVEIQVSKEFKPFRAQLLALCLIVSLGAPFNIWMTIK